MAITSSNKVDSSPELNKDSMREASIGSGRSRPEPTLITDVLASGPTYEGFGCATGLKKLTFTPSLAKALTKPKLIDVTPTPVPIGISIIVCAT